MQLEWRCTRELGCDMRASQANVGSIFHLDIEHRRATVRTSPRLFRHSLDRCVCLLPGTVTPLCPGPINTRALFLTLTSRYLSLSLHMTVTESEPGAPCAILSLLDAPCAQLIKQGAEAKVYSVDLWTQPPHLVMPDGTTLEPVSYTHLTLPTKRIV